AAGVGINLAQRLMDCGDAGHILLSKRVAEDLQQDGRWRPHLHDLGEVEVKHGERVHVFNFYTGDAGNADPPRKLSEAKPHHQAAARSPEKAAQRGRFSICVLPFANMSGDTEQEYFSDGISEDIITDLSQVSALHVKLLPEEKKAIERRGTDNVEAYNLYLLGRQIYTIGFEGDRRRGEAIIRFCQRAVEIDPNYAEAWALIAMAEMALRSHF